MRRRVRCPECRAQLVIVVPMVEPKPQLHRAAEVKAADSGVTLAERVDRRLALAGKRGMTIRELQQALKGPKADDIAAVLMEWANLLDANPTFERDDGRRHYFVLKAAAVAGNAADE